MGDHSKNFSAPPDEDTCQAAVDKLKAVFPKLSVRQQHLLCDGISLWADHILAELDFEPKNLKRYEYGEIIIVDFGYRVGSELGGVHPALVAEWGNPMSSKSISVIPISSYGTDKQRKDLRHHEVHIGKIKGLHKESYAKVMGLQAISKIRITKPLKAYRLGIIPDRIMEDIEKVISRCYMRKRPARPIDVDK